MELKETIPMMTDPDYKERFRAEFFQLQIRKSKLFDLLKKMESGTLGFTPACSFELLAEQYQAMSVLTGILENRAEIEGIDLSM